jgi:formylglycine-generating enzyme required for sulfatase activity/serine/threonine protein kinase
MAEFDDLVFGKYIVDEGLSKEDLQEALALKHSLEAEGRKKDIWDILFERSYLPLAKISLARRKAEEGISCDKCQTQMLPKQHDGGNQLRCPSCNQTIFDLAEGTLERLVEEVKRRDMEWPFGRKGVEEPGAKGGKKTSRSMIGKTISGHRVSSWITTTDIMHVYLADCTEEGRTDVAKIFLRDDPKHSRQAARFARETRKARKLDHPYMVKVLDVGEAKDFVFVFEEYVKGIDLEDLLSGLEGIRPYEALMILKKLCRALGHAHGKHVLHHDIRPQNVLLTTEGTVKLKGFGMARSTEAADCFAFSGEITGVANYLAPEVIDLKTPDKRADIYALGSTFYYMLTGKAPFEGQSVMNVLFSQLAEDPLLPSRFNRDVPANYEILTSKMMAKDIHDRYSSAAEILTDIGRIERGEALKPPKKKEEEKAEAKALPKEKEIKIESLAPTNRVPLYLYSAMGAILVGLFLLITLWAKFPDPFPDPIQYAGKRMIERAKSMPASSWEERSRVIAQYRYIAERFPTSPWASVAHRQMVLLQKQSREEEEALWRKAIRPSLEARKTGDWVSAYHALDDMPARCTRGKWLERLRAERAAILGEIRKQFRRALVPAGSFTSGTGAEKSTVYLDDFFMDLHEVSNARYAAFVKATGHPPPRHWRGGKPPAGKESHPVVFVSLTDAQAYAKWAGKRLPTEMEWEKAARGTDGRSWPWGDRFIADVANFKDAGKGNTVPVGSYPRGKSPYGVLDMAGNVWEWAVRPGSKKGVIRGGSWESAGTSEGRCVYFVDKDPGTRKPDIGFRCVSDKPR